MPRLPARLRRLWPLAKAVHTVSTGLASPVTSRVSHLFGRGLPIAVARTAQDAVAGGGALYPAFPAEAVTRALPEGQPAGHWRFAATASKQIPATLTMELPGGRVLAPYAAVLTGDDHLVYSVSSYFGTDRPGRHPMFWHPFTPAVQQVAGRLAVLTSRGDANYFHFLLDVLPRLGVLERSGRNAERFLVPYARTFQRELLAAAGVSAGRVLDSTRHRHVQAEVLVVPDLPARDLQTPAWLVSWLRAVLLPAARPALLGGTPIAAGQTRLYVSRGRARHTRRVHNEDEVLAALLPRGFTVIDPAAMSVTEQIAAFAGAQTVVAPHGAALANLAFASPGCEVLELFAPDYVNTCFWELSTQVPGLHYRYLVGAGSSRAMAGISSDIRVDVAALQRMLG